LSAIQLLSLERSYSPSSGWAIQLFVTAPLFSATDVSQCTEGFASGCAEAHGTPLRKTMILDLLEASRHLGLQSDNYEAISLGPLLPDGRRLLLMVNDDNCAQYDASSCWGGNLIGTQFLASALDVDAALRAAATPGASGPDQAGLDHSDPKNAYLLGWLGVGAVVAAGCSIWQLGRCRRRRAKLTAGLLARDCVDMDTVVADAFSADNSPPSTDRP
jgi:hypothetical protein